MNEEPDRGGKAKWLFPAIVIILGILLVPRLPTLTIGCSALVTIHRADAGFRKAKKIIDSEQLRSWALKESGIVPGRTGFPLKNSTIGSSCLHKKSLSEMSSRCLGKSKNQRKRWLRDDDLGWRIFPLGISYRSNQLFVSDERRIPSLSVVPWNVLPARSRLGPALKLAILLNPSAAADHSLKNGDSPDAARKY